MPAPNVAFAKGMSVTYGTSSAAFSGEVTGIESEIERESVDATHLGSTAPTTSQFAGLIMLPAPFGTLRMKLLAHLRPAHMCRLHTADNETITIAHPFTTDNWSGSGHVRKVTPRQIINQKMTCEIEIQATGVWTSTQGA